MCIRDRFHGTRDILESGTVAGVCPDSPTGRGDVLKQHSVWVRIPLGAPFHLIHRGPGSVGGQRNNADMYPICIREQALTFLEGGRSLNSVSRQLGISRAAIREWREFGVQPKHRPAICFRCEQCPSADEAAYSLLLGYYLGDGCISQQRSTFSMRVSCDKTYPGIVADVTSAIEAVHKNGSSLSSPGSRKSSSISLPISCADSFTRTVAGLGTGRLGWSPVKRSGTSTPAGSSPTTRRTSCFGARKPWTCSTFPGASPTGRLCRSPRRPQWPDSTS